MVFEIQHHPISASTTHRAEAESIEVAAIIAEQKIWTCQPGDVVTISDTDGHVLGLFRMAKSRQLVQIS